MDTHTQPLQKWQSNFLWTQPQTEPFEIQSNTFSTISIFGPEVQKRLKSSKNTWRHVLNYWVFHQRFRDLRVTIEPWRNRIRAWLCDVWLVTMIHGPISFWLRKRMYRWIRGICLRNRANMREPFAFRNHLGLYHDQYLGTTNCILKRTKNNQLFVYFFLSGGFTSNGGWPIATPFGIPQWK